MYFTSPAGWAEDRTVPVHHDNAHPSLRGATTLQPADGPVEGDAFGRLLTRCWVAGGGRGVAYEVLERDDGYLFVEDAARYFAGPDDWRPLDRLACERVAGRILDVGCGAGRHAVHLREAGYDVVGLDASPGAAAVARQRGVTVVSGSIHNPPAIPVRFDTLLLLDNGLGFLGNRETAPLVLRNLASLANPGAIVLATGLDPRSAKAGDTLEYCRRNRENGRYPGQFRVRVRDGVLASVWFDHLLLSPEELTELVTDSPWELDDLVPGNGAGYLATLKL